MSVYLRLFGRPRVESDGVVQELPVERRCLLLLVLGSRRTWVARAELAALFWPTQRPELAATNLRKALHFARALPWAHALEMQGLAVRFGVATDLHDFELARREGRHADALALRRGPLLDGLDDAANPAWTEWLDAERAQHERHWSELTRARLVELEAQPEASAALARRLLDADPLDEDAVVALLSAQRARGRFDEQRETFRAFASQLRDELGVEPSMRVHEQLRGAVPAGEAPDGDGFFGREQELLELAALLARPECRLLTITGPGGIGKSTLAKQALRRLASLSSTTPLWIALDDLGDVTQAIARIATELKLVPGPSQEPLQAVCEALKPRRALLVFDNGEHLDGLARLAERLLAESPRLQICATSRVRLGAAGEWLLPLHGLAADDGARLFVAAARAHKPDFVAAAHGAAIAAVVQKVAALPLAILLAAHWARLWPVAEIAAELERSLDVLESAEEGEERPEHRSVRATFERSWRMLAEREQSTLAALTVFVGGFARDAAEDVADATWPLLSSLADKSLLQIEASRCSLHPLIRQFAGERHALPDRAATQRRHAQWFHRLLSRSAVAIENGERAVLEEIERDLENCRLAWRWAIAEGAHAEIASAALPLMRFFEVRGRTLEGLMLLREAQAALNPDSAPASAAAVGTGLAQLLFRTYRLDEAEAAARQALRHARSAGDRGTLALCLNVLGNCLAAWGRSAEAKRLFQQSLRHARGAGDFRTAAVAIGNLAMVEARLGNVERSRELMVDLLAQHRELGNWHRMPTILNNLAALQLAQGAWAEARDYSLEGLDLSERHGIAQVRPHLLLNLANARFGLDELDASERVTRELIDDASTMSNRAVQATGLAHLVRIAMRRGDCAAARARLRDAMAAAAGMKHASIQLDLLFSYAKIQAAEGQAGRAAPLLRYFAAREDVEPVERADALALLGRLGGDAVELPPPALALDALVAQIASELAVAAAP